jgi:hypothetical protein
MNEFWESAYSGNKKMWGEINRMISASNEKYIVIQELGMLSGSNTLLGVLVILLLSNCRSKPEYLVKFYEGDVDKMGTPFGYLNAKGDTIIFPGTYDYGYMDTIRNFWNGDRKGNGSNTRD